MNCRILPLVIGSLLLALGCGSDSPAGPTGGAPTPVATTLTLSATVLSFSTFGETEQLTATVRDQNGATLSGASVAWASSPLSVASVSSTGLVTAVADGTATVTATSGSATGTASVTVQQAATPTGGSVSLADGAVILVFPPGAVSQPVIITAVPATDLPPEALPISGTAFDLGPDGMVFDEPVGITVAYDPTLIPAGVPEEGLRLFKLVSGRWELLDGAVDTEANTVTGSTTSFSTFGTLSISGFCSTVFDGITSFATFAEAFDAVIPGGTIEVCDGTHVVEGVVISAPVTIQPEPGASPVIETSVELTAFLLNGYSSGTVVFDGLIFDLSTPSINAEVGQQDSPSNHSYVIRGKGTYDQLIVRNSTFNIDLASEGSVLLWTNTVTGSATLVENTTFNGGADGVSSFEAGPDTQLNVRTSQFFGTRFFGLAYDGSSGRVENSTFTDCFGGNCIFAGNGSHVDVVSNVFGAPDLSGVVTFSLNNIVQYRTGSSGLVDDNDFGGCGEFRCVRIMHVGTQVDVTNNRFQVDPSDAVNVNAFHSVVRHDFGAIGTVENNQFTGCFYACIGVYRGAVVSVLGNDISIPFGHSTTWAIHGFEGNSDPPSLTIEDNTIIADLTGVDLSDPSTFRIAGGGIAMDGAFATVYRNTIVGAARGVSAFNDGLITAGEDNIIDRSNVGVMSLEDTSIKLNFNDITNSFVPIFAEFITSDLDCNWWGVTAGPASTADVVDSDTFTPFATAPIAGTDHSGCSPLAAENLFVGSWTATSIVRDGVEILVGTDVSFNLTFRSDLTFSESVSGDTGNLFCDDATSCTDGGTYVFTSTHFSLCDPNCDEIFEYAISGNTITVTFEEGGVMFTFTLVRVMSSAVLFDGDDSGNIFPFAATSDIRYQQARRFGVR